MYNPEALPQWIWLLLLSVKVWRFCADLTAQGVWIFCTHLGCFLILASFNSRVLVPYCNFISENFTCSKGLTNVGSHHGPSNSPLCEVGQGKAAVQLSHFIWEPRRCRQVLLAKHVYLHQTNNPKKKASTSIPCSPWQSRGRQSHPEQCTSLGKS